MNESRGWSYRAGGGSPCLIRRRAQVNPINHSLTHPPHPHTTTEATNTPCLCAVRPCKPEGRKRERERGGGGFPSGGLTPNPKLLQHTLSLRCRTAISLSCHLPPASPPLLHLTFSIPVSAFFLTHPRCCHSLLYPRRRILTSTRSNIHDDLQSLASKV